MTNVKIDHPMLKRSIKSSQPTMPAITIGSPDDYDEDGSAPPEGAKPMPDAVKAAMAIDLERLKQASAAPEPNFDDPLIQEELRKREVYAKIMAHRVPITKSIEIDGLSYVFKILTPEETGETIRLLMGLPENERTALRERGLMMAAAIVSVGGLPLESLYDGPAIEDVVLKKYYQIFDWPNPLFNNLLRQLDNFVEEVRVRYLPDFLKQPKTESKG